MRDAIDAMFEALAAAFASLGPVLDAGADWLAEQPPVRQGIAIGLIAGFLTLAWSVLW